MRYFLIHITENKLLAIALPGVCALACWIPSLLNTPWQTIATLAIAIVNAVIFMQICYQTNLTRTHALLPVLMYLLPLSSVSALHTAWQAQIIGTCMLLMLMQLTSTYRSDNATEEAFLSTIILTAAAFLCPDMLYFIPALWLIFAFQQSLNLKVFLATAIAIALAAIALAVLYYMPQTAYSIDFESMVHRLTWQPTVFNITITIAATTAVVFMAFALVNFSSENVSGQTYITISAIPLLTALLLFLFPSQHLTFMPTLLLLFLGVFATHFFLSRQSIPRGITYLCYILLTLTNRILDMTIY